MTGREHRGVRLSDQPLDSNEGACGDVLLRVNLACTEGEIADYEWVEEGKGYREWLIPAALLNRRAKISRRPDPLRRLTAASLSAPLVSRFAAFGPGRCPYAGRGCRTVVTLGPDAYVRGRGATGFQARHELHAKSC